MRALIFGVGLLLATGCVTTHQVSAGPDGSAWVVATDSFLFFSGSSHTYHCAKGDSFGGPDDTHPMCREAMLHDLHAGPAAPIAMAPAPAPAPAPTRRETPVTVTIADEDDAPIPADERGGSGPIMPKDEAPARSGGLLGGPVAPAGPSSYKVLISRAAARDFKDLDSDDKRGAKRALKRLESGPDQAGAEKGGGSRWVWTPDDADVMLIYVVEGDTIQVLSLQED